MKTTLLNMMIAASLACLVFAGCSSSSGGGSSTSSTTDTTNGPAGPGNDGSITLSTMVAVGAMTKGSVKVNGVEFQVNANTAITADDNPKPGTFLDNGMTVKVKGSLNAGGITGTAEKVEVVSEARGAIETKGTDTLAVHGQTVLVDGGTVLKDAAGAATSFGNFTSGENIEVHGGRDDTGVIRATRVQKLAAGAVPAGAENEVRGAVSGKTAASFNIGSLPITFSAGTTTVVPSTASFADIVDGTVVQVQLDPTGNAATKITVENLNHPEFEAAEGQESSFEGILKGFSTTGVFAAGTQQVQLSASARIDGGVLADLVDGMKVEAEGHNVANGVLTAEKITIKDNVRFETNAEAAGSASVLGKTVTLTSGTRFSGLASSATITVGDGLRIRGFLNRDGSTLTATRIDKVNAVAPDKIIIQGPVSTIDATGHTFTIMGISVSAGGAIARPNDDRSADNTATIDLGSFFSSLTDGLTVVKAKGTFSGGALTATEVELE